MCDVPPVSPSDETGARCVTFHQSHRLTRRAQLRRVAFHVTNPHVRDEERFKLSAISEHTILERKSIYIFRIINQNKNYSPTAEIVLINSYFTTIIIFVFLN